MSQSLTLARPYARAAFAVARDGNAFAAWSDALAVAARIAADPQVSTLLLNPELADAQAVSLLQPPHADESFARFLGVLAAAGRLPLLPEIAAMYEQLRAEAEQVVHATITSAADLPTGELDALIAAIKRRFGGRDVAVRTAVDPALLGGAVIDVGDEVIDGSLKGKLARLQTALAN